MTNLYVYEPFYGIEAWKNIAGAPADSFYGGGAELTAQNLIISLWLIESSANELPSSGQLFRPFYATALASATNTTYGATGLYNAPGELPSFKSRNSAKFLINAFDVVQPENPALLAILNPPQDIKTLYQNAVQTAANPAKPFGIDLNVLKPCRLASQAFDVQLAKGTGVMPTFGGSYLVGDFMSPFYQPPYQGFPLCYTSGSNGVFPLFMSSLGRRALGFDPVSAWLESIDAINRGDFYIPIYLQPNAPSEGEVTQTLYTINWPHSGARN